MPQHIRVFILKMLRKMEIELIRDRGRMKLRVNLIRDDLVLGWLKPIEKF